MCYNASGDACIKTQGFSSEELDLELAIQLTEEEQGATTGILGPMRYYSVVHIACC